jgi:hypothetical protein
MFFFPVVHYFYFSLARNLNFYSSFFFQLPHQLLFLHFREIRITFLYLYFPLIFHFGDLFWHLF